MKHSIKTAFERQTKAVTLKPSIGQNTAVTKAFPPLLVFVSEASVTNYKPIS